MADSLRGKAAIVGVADLASPTGELDLHGRALEIAVIKAALDDAGLTIGDVDGVCHALSSMALKSAPVQIASPVPGVTMPCSCNTRRKSRWTSRTLPT